MDPMKTRIGACATLMVGCLLVARPLVAQTTSAAGGAANRPGNFLTECTQMIEYNERRFVSLSEAFPAEKYAWSPGPGVRSVSQIFLHVTHRNFTQTLLIGTMPPPNLAQAHPGFVVGELNLNAPNTDAMVRSVTGEGIVETTTTDKARVVASLKASFVHFKDALKKLSPSDESKPVVWIGQNTYRGVCLFWARHLGEHLGQAIAYARMTGVVPPWTAAAEERRAREGERAR
ncbi:MAG: DinB family protein [Vicinamibacterales bacterium]